MKCESVRRQLTAYLDGELEDHRGSAVRGHLRSCEACRRVASDEAALRDGLRALPPLDPPPSLWEGVQRQLAAAEIADAERPAWRRALARLVPRTSHLGVAAAAVAAAVALLVLRAKDGDAPASEPLAVSPDRLDEAEPTHRTARAPAQPARDEGDVSTELAAEPARVTDSYAQTVRELLAIANDARAQWPEERKRELDRQVAALQKEAANAADERTRQQAYRKLIRYLQRAVIRDDVALASVGGMP